MELQHPQAQLITETTLLTELHLGAVGSEQAPLSFSHTLETEPSLRGVQHKTRQGALRRAKAGFTPSNTLGDALLLPLFLKSRGSNI